MACATVIEEMQPFLPDGMPNRVFDFGLHINPARLRENLQEAVHAEGGKYETILLGYGLCSQALVGIRASACRLVAPRVDDCIALFLGSRRAYENQFKQQPGTYYLTRGWIEVGDTPFTEHERNIQRYGEERANYIYQVMMGNYQRLALINPGDQALDRYRDYARLIAEKFHLQYDEIKGSSRLLKKLLAGEWDDEFVVLEKGQVFTLDQFLPTGNGAA
jgi:hypothetical protein